MSWSTPEAELVAAATALRVVGIPALPLWAHLLSEDRKIKFREDNEAMIRVMKTGRNPTMRSLGRTHRISVAWLHERFAQGDFELAYEKSDKQAADVMTKAFTDANKWAVVCKLVNHVRPKELAALMASESSMQGVTPQPSRSPGAPAKSLQLGQVITLPEKQVRDMTAALEKIDWPKQSRTVVRGKGTCVGATFDPKGPRLGSYTDRSKDAIRIINSCIQSVPEFRGFEWGSLQINKNSVSTPHVDRNNTGPSVIILLGQFTGGRFE